MASLRSFWQHDLLRQSFKAFVIGLIVAIACGLIITFFWRVPPSRVAEVVEAGQADGRARGLHEGQRDGQSAGRRAGHSQFESLAATGSFEDGRDFAFDRAWNDAIDAAIEQAAHTPLIQLRRLDYWESLRR